LNNRLDMEEEAKNMTDNYAVFMDADLSPFIGEWVAICDGKVISHDPSLKRAFEMAKKECPDKRPLLTKVPTTDTLIL